MTSVAKEPTPVADRAAGLAPTAVLAPVAAEDVIVEEPTDGKAKAPPPKADDKVKGEGVKAVGGDNGSNETDEWSKPLLGSFGETEHETKGKAGVIKSFTPIVTEIADYIRAYMQSNNVPSEDQMAFLDAYVAAKGNVAKMLQSEEGIMLADAMLEQMLGLMQTLAPQQVQLKKTGVVVEPIETLDLLRTRTSARHLIERDITKAAKGLEFGIKKALGPGEIWELGVVPTYQLDADNLPPEYKAFMQFVGKIPEQNRLKFMKNVATALESFYTSMGVDEERLNGLSVFGLMAEAVRNPVVTEENVSLNFAYFVNNRRNEILRENGFFTTKEKGERERKFFEANMGVIKSLAAVSKDKIEARDKTIVTKSVSTIEARRAEFVGPDRLKKERARQTKEKELLEAELNNNNASLKYFQEGNPEKKQPGYNDLVLEAGELKADEPKRNEEIAKVDGFINKWEAEIAPLRDEITKARRERDTKLSASGDKDKERKAQILLDYERSYGDKDRRFTALQTELDKLNLEKKELDGQNIRQARLEARATYYKTEIDRLTGEIKRLEGEIQGKQETIEAEGLSESDIIIRNEMDAALQALRGYELLFGTVNDPVEWRKYNAAFFTDTSRNSEEIKRAVKETRPQGLVEIYRFLFDIEHPPKGIKSSDEYLRAIMQLLPPQEVALDLLEALNIKISSSTTGDLLRDTFAAIQAQTVKPNRMGEVLMYMLKKIEIRGLQLYNI